MLDRATIRRADLRDVERLHGLVERAYRGDSARRGWTHEADLLGGQRTDREELTAILTDPTEAVLVAENGEQLVGCVRVTDEGESRAHLGMLSVEPELQAAGLGRRLVAAAEAGAAALFGARRMAMSVIRQRPELIAWYERRGYRLTGEEEPFPLDDPRLGLPRTRELVFVVMAKDLG